MMNSRPRLKTSCGFLNQILIWQLCSIHQLGERIPENVFVLPIVKPMLQFIQIGVQMLNAHLMIRTDDGALEQAPDALNAVSVNVADNPFLGRVVNPMVLRVGILNAPIGRKLVGVDRFRVGRGVVVNELVQGRLVRVLDDLKPNLSRRWTAPMAIALFPFVAAAHPAHLPADVGFVHFDNAPQKLGVNLAHGSADAMAEMPRGLIGNVQRALDLERGHAFLDSVIR